MVENQKMSFFIKKNVTCLRRRFKFTLLVLFAIGVYYLMTHLYSYLAPQQKIESDYLVVESWMNDESLKESLNIFRSGHYNHMFITGGPLNKGYYLMDYKSSSDFALDAFLYFGASADSMSTISRDLVWRDRTYHTALELKDYLQNNYPQVKSFNLVSQGAHSRRSWILFQQALPNYEIGIITIDEKLYDKERWWTTSTGFRSVFTEAFGYFYIRFFFKPY